MKHFGPPAAVGKQPTASRNPVPNDLPATSRTQVYALRQWIHLRRQSLDNGCRVAGKYESDKGYPVDVLILVAEVWERRKAAKADWLWLSGMTCDRFIGC